MDWKLAVELILFFITLSGTIIGALFVFVRRMDSRFAESADSQAKNFEAVKSENRNSFHQLDKKIHGVEIVVGPYARDIIALKEQQNGNVLEISKLRNQVNNSIEACKRLERQVESIHQRGMR